MGLLRTLYYLSQLPAPRAVDFQARYDCFQNFHPSETYWKAVETKMWTEVLCKAEKMRSEIWIRFSPHRG